MMLLKHIHLFINQIARKSHTSSINLKKFFFFVIFLFRVRNAFDLIIESDVGMLNATKNNATKMNYHQNFQPEALGIKLTNEDDVKMQHISELNKQSSNNNILNFQATNIEEIVFFENIKDNLTETEVSEFPLRFSSNKSTLLLDMAPVVKSNKNVIIFSSFDDNDTLNNKDTTLAFEQNTTQFRSKNSLDSLNLVFNVFKSFLQLGLKRRKKHSSQLDEKLEKNLLDSNIHHIVNETSISLTSPNKDVKQEATTIEAANSNSKTMPDDYSTVQLFSSSNQLKAFLAKKTNSLKSNEEDPTLIATKSTTNNNKKVVTIKPKSLDVNSSSSSGGVKKATIITNDCLTRDHPSILLLNKKSNTTKPQSVATTSSKPKYTRKFSIKFHPFSFKLPSSFKQPQLQQTTTSTTTTKTITFTNRGKQVTSMNQRCCLSVSVVPSDKHGGGNKKSKKSKNNALNNEEDDDNIDDSYTKETATEKLLVNKNKQTSSKLLAKDSKGQPKTSFEQIAPSTSGLNNIRQTTNPVVHSESKTSLIKQDEKFVSSKPSVNSDHENKCDQRVDEVEEPKTDASVQTLVDTQNCGIDAQKNINTLTISSATTSTSGSLSTASSFRAKSNFDNVMNQLDKEYKNRPNNNNPNTIKANENLLIISNTTSNTNTINNSCKEDSTSSCVSINSTNLSYKNINFNNTISSRYKQFEKKKRNNMQQQHQSSSSPTAQAVAPNRPITVNTNANQELPSEIYDFSLRINKLRFIDDSASSTALTSPAESLNHLYFGSITSLSRKNSKQHQHTLLNSSNYPPAVCTPTTNDPCSTTSSSRTVSLPPSTNCSISNSALSTPTMSYHNQHRMRPNALSTSSSGTNRLAFIKRQANVKSSSETLNSDDQSTSNSVKPNNLSSSPIVKLNKVDGASSSSSSTSPSKYSSSATSSSQNRMISSSQMKNVQDSSSSKMISKEDQTVIVDMEDDEEIKNIIMHNLNEKLKTPSYSYPHNKYVNSKQALSNRQNNNKIMLPPSSTSSITSTTSTTTEVESSSSDYDTVNDSTHLNNNSNHYRNFNCLTSEDHAAKNHRILQLSTTNDSSADDSFCSNKASKGKTSNSNNCKYCKMLTTSATTTTNTSNSSAKETTGSITSSASVASTASFSKGKSKANKMKKLSATSPYSSSSYSSSSKFSNELSAFPTTPKNSVISSYHYYHGYSPIKHQERVYAYDNFDCINECLEENDQQYFNYQQQQQQQHQQRLNQHQQQQVLNKNDEHEEQDEQEDEEEEEKCFTSILVEDGFIRMSSPVDEYNSSLSAQSDSKTKSEKQQHQKQPQQSIPPSYSSSSSSSKSNDSMKNEQLLANRVASSNSASNVNHSFPNVGSSPVSQEFLNSSTDNEQDYASQDDNKKNYERLDENVTKNGGGCFDMISKRSKKSKIKIEREDKTVVEEDYNGEQVENEDEEIDDDEEVEEEEDEEEIDEDEEEEEDVDENYECNEETEDDQDVDGDEEVDCQEDDEDDIEHLLEQQDQEEEDDDDDEDENEDDEEDDGEMNQNTYCLKDQENALRQLKYDDQGSELIENEMLDDGVLRQFDSDSTSTPPPNKANLSSFKAQNKRVQLQHNHLSSKLQYSINQKASTKNHLLAMQQNNDLNKTPQSIMKNSSFKTTTSSVYAAESANYWQYNSVEMNQIYKKEIKMQNIVKSSLDDSLSSSQSISTFNNYLNSPNTDSSVHSRTSNFNRSNTSSDQFTLSNQLVAAAAAAANAVSSNKPKVRFNLDINYEKEREWNRVNKIIGDASKSQIEWTQEVEV